MQITQELPDFRYLCRGVSAEGVLVNERELRASFLLTPNELVEDWALDALTAADDTHWQTVLDLQPALFSMAAAFAGIWLFSVTDRSAGADMERARFLSQFIRSQTGHGASGAVDH